MASDPGSSPGLTIVLLGNSGAGKSASGNTILGQAVFESKRSFASVTKQISAPAQTELFGKQISVVDTPGILGSEQRIQARCQELLQSSTPCLFLIVVKIDRFTIEQKNAVEAAVRVIGDQGFNNCYLLFTYGDVLDNMSLDEFIDEPEGLLNPLVERFAGRYHVFINNNGGQEQVRELLMKSGHLGDVVSDPEPARRIVLLGLPGGGKSASGNTILGSDRFQSTCGFQSVSTETVSESAIVEGRQITVVDTPGITGKVLSPRKLFGEIMTSVAEADPGPHAFVIVVRIGRISEADIKLFQMLPKLFRKDALKHMMVLFTHADMLKGQSIKDLIKNKTCVSELVSMCGGRYCVFDNTKRGNRVQVTDLLHEINEMVNANNEEHYTSDMFCNDQTFSVKMCYRVKNIQMAISNRWAEVYEWFIQKLRELDSFFQKNTVGYNHLVT